MHNIRKTKIDKVDTYIISKALMLQQFHQFVTIDDISLMNLNALGLLLPDISQVTYQVEELS